jgi:Family of unknown function (DUF5677)
MTHKINEALGLIEDLLKLAEEVCDAAIEKHTELAGLGAMFLARAGQSAFSAGLLAQHGFNGDAMSVARTVTEMAIDYRFIALDPTARIKRFIDYDLVANYKIAQAIDKLHDGAIDKATMCALKQRHDMAKATNPSSTGNWAGINLRKRAEEIDNAMPNKPSYVQIYELLYADQCNASHSCYGTLGYALLKLDDEDPQLHFGSMPPNVKPPTLAFATMMVLIDDVIEVNCLDASFAESLKMIQSRQRSLADDLTPAMTT